MRIIFLGLSLLAILMASKRFTRFETVGYDSGALFLLLIGIQLLVTAAIFYDHHESRTSKRSTPVQGQEGADNTPSGNQAHDGGSSHRET
ncbi:MAG: hypothetical protein OEY28_10825 [Nitrospira sp.]|nr:hypothetical protein [Nitrospira sp.]